MGAEALERGRLVTESIEENSYVIEDQRLLEQYRRGDHSAYGRLFDKHWSKSLNYARRYSRSGADAEDLAQDAFTRVMETIGRGKGPTISMGHYLRTTIRTIAIGRSRGNTLQEVPTDHDTLAAIFEATTFRDEEDMSNWLVDGFNKLTGRQQSVVWEHAIERRSFRAMAPEMGLSFATVSRAYRQAMAELRTGFAQATADQSSDPECARFALALVNDDSHDEALQQHLAGCARCQAVRRRLVSQDKAIMSVILVAGLGELGLAATKLTKGSVILAWFAALAIPAKVAVIVVPVAALVLGGVVVANNVAATDHVSGNSSVASASVVLGDASGASEIVSLGECRVLREPVSSAREVWRVAGGPECGMRVEMDQVTLLDTSVDPALLAVEIASPGRYTVTVTDGASTTATTNVTVTR